VIKAIRFLQLCAAIFVSSLALAEYGARMYQYDRLINKHSRTSAIKLAANQIKCCIACSYPYLNWRNSPY